MTQLNKQCEGINRGPARILATENNVVHTGFIIYTRRNQINSVKVGIVDSPVGTLTTRGRPERYLVYDTIIK